MLASQSAKVFLVDFGIRSAFTLYNDEGLLVGEGTCHSVNSDLVLGATCPLSDTHVAVFVAKSHSEEHLPQERVYSLVAWPIQYVHCRGASLQDHDA